MNIEKMELAFKRWAFDNALPTIRATDGKTTYWHAETESAWLAFSAGYQLGLKEQS